MTRIVRIMLLLATLACGHAFAQQDLSGPWQGKLAVDAKTTLSVQFTFSKHPDGTYSAVLDSPDNAAIKNVPVNSVTFMAGTLKMTVAALSGSYEGTLKDGKFDGHWTQPGGTLPLLLSAYQKPVLTKAAISTLVGAWNGPIPVPGAKFTFLVRFKLNDKGEVTGTLSVPEQPERGEPPLADISFTDNTLEFQVPAAGGTFKYHGTYANGVITGTWLQAGAPPPGRAITIVMRFEVNGGGQYVGFIDSPDQGVKGKPIAEASLAAGKLNTKMNAPPAQFEGTVSDKTITGQWMQGPPGQPPMSTPLTLTRE
jgi:hypothetical protein